MAPRTLEQLPEGRKEQPKGMLEAVKEAARKGVGALKQQVEEYKEKPHGTYTFERSAYENVDTKADFERSYKYLVLQTGAAKIDVFLRGVADNTTFQLDPKNPRQVDLNRGPDFQAKFLHALTTLKATGGVIGLSGLDFNKDGLKAIHKLPLNKQQETMNHAIAYLRAERLQRDLQNACGGNPAINFLISTEWATNPKTRKATMMDVVVTKDLSTDEMLEKEREKTSGQSVRPATKEDIPPLLRKEAPKQKYEGGKYFGKTEPVLKGPYSKLRPADKEEVDKSVVAWIEEFLDKESASSITELESIYKELNAAGKKKLDESVAWLKKFLGTEPQTAYDQLNDEDKEKVRESIAWIRALQHPTAQEGIWDKDVQAKAYKKPKANPVKLGSVSREGIWDKGVQAKADPVHDNEDFLATASQDKQSVLPPAAPKKPTKTEIPPLLRKEAPKPKYEGGKYWGTTEYPKKPEAKSAYDQLSPAEKKIVDDSLGRVAPPAPSARMEAQLRQARSSAGDKPAAKPLEWKPTDYKAAAKKKVDEPPNDGFTVRRKQAPPPAL